jgi:putative oxidoreductase
VTSLTSHINLQIDRGVRALEGAQPAAQLLARLYLAKVFFLAGLTKVRDWDITLTLFTDEYHVPLLSPTLAAWLGTGAELLLPVLLVLGMGGRVAALGLFVLNAVAVISLGDVAEAALQQHLFWGSLLLALLLWGPGRWSVDTRWFASRARGPR